VEDAMQWPKRIGELINRPVARPAAIGQSSRDTRECACKELYCPPGHFYSPVVDRKEADKHLSALEAANMPESLPDIEIDRGAMLQIWRQLVPFMATSPFGDKPSGKFRYGFENPYYSWGDASVLYAMIRIYRPRRIIEIGSGWSSICIADTVEHFLGGSCKITLIEPYPRRLLDLLRGEEPAPNITILKSAVQDIAPDYFACLEPSDFLFIDSSHILRTGSDVCYELFEILPRLLAGVIVHIHDIFWPFEYPRRWAVDENRSWNELYAVRAFLTCNHFWKILMFNSYLAHMERKVVECGWPNFYRRDVGALWLQRQ
jgi:predicted O-methyltransferase YrrM